MLLERAGSLSSCARILSGLREEGAPLNKRASSQVEADARLCVQIMLAAAQARTKQGGKVRGPEGASHKLACRSLFRSHWNEPRVQDVKLFVSELKRTALLSPVSVKNMFEMISWFCYSCGLGLGGFLEGVHLNKHITKIGMFSRHPTHVV